MAALFSCRVMLRSVASERFLQRASSDEASWVCYSAWREPLPQSAPPAGVQRRRLGRDLRRHQRRAAGYLSALLQRRAYDARRALPRGRVLAADAEARPRRAALWRHPWTVALGGLRVPNHGARLHDAVKIRVLDRGSRAAGAGV